MNYNHPYRKAYGMMLEPSFWKKVHTDDAYQWHRTELEKDWNRYCTGPLEELSYRSYKRFFLDGDRKVFQKAYFARRRGMYAAALLALIEPENPEYLNRLMDHIWAACNEYCWAVPAHQESLERMDPCFIDLFASETAANLAQIAVLLQDRLDPLILHRIREELRRRILEPYRSRTFWWEPVTANWSIVCTCGVAITVLDFFPEELESLLPRFERSASCFLSGYGDDGFCPEGPMYWYYGFGFFTIYAERIRSAVGIDHFKNPKVRTIASFGQKKYLSGSAEVTFADAEMHTSYNLGIQHFLHREYPEHVTIPPLKFASLWDDMARFSLLLRSFAWYDPSVSPEDSTGIFYGENVQWLLIKQSHFGVAIKAGHNDEPHNHNDLGSFIFAGNGRQILVDPGRGEYCKDYFRDGRYRFLHTSSRGHSVPILNGQYQKHGAEHRAQDVCWDGTTFRMELKDAYSLPELRSLIRSFTILENGLRLEDRFDLTGTVTERFVSMEEPVIQDGAICFRDAVLKPDTLLPVSVQKIETVHGYGTPQTLYLIDLPLPEDTTFFGCTVRISEHP